MTYDEWVSGEAEKIASEINRRAMGGRYDGSIYCFHAKDLRPGFLAISTSRKEDAEIVICSPATIPRSELRQTIYEKCRNIPVLPKKGE